MAEFSSNRLETPLKRVRGLGSARSGTEHFWRQRITSVALVPLTIAFLIILLRTQGHDHASVVATLSHPLPALLMLLFIGASIDHMRIGMQVIIEDYVHVEGSKITLLLLNSFFSYALGLACVFAVLKMSFGG
jgi:succinate dehydrogenase / fumarate reductase, membrane anchor subunit